MPVTAAIGDQLLERCIEHHVGRITICLAEKVAVFWKHSFSLYIQEILISVEISLHKTTSKNIRREFLFKFQPLGKSETFLRDS